MRTLVLVKELGVLDTSTRQFITWHDLIKRCSRRFRTNVTSLKIRCFDHRSRRSMTLSHLLYSPFYSRWCGGRGMAPWHVYM